MPIVLLSTSQVLQEELSALVRAQGLLGQVFNISTLEEFESLALDAPIAIFLDADWHSASIGKALAKVRKRYPVGSVVVVFEELDELAMSRVIQQGADAFALRGRLSALTQLWEGLHALATTGTQADTMEMHALFDLAEPSEMDSLSLGRNSHRILKALLEESTDSIWVKGLDGKYLLINPAGARFLGKSIEEIIGKTDFDVFLPETAEKVRVSDQQVIQEELPQTVEDFMITLDGASRTFQAVKGVFRDEQGRVQGVIGTVRDITLRKHAEEALKQSEQRFRLLVDGVKDHAIYMLDPQGCVTTWNVGAERVQGYTSEEIVGRHFSCFYPQEDIADGHPEEGLNQALSQGFYEKEGWHIRKDGSLYWANLMITPLFQEDGQLLGFSNVVRDMTERRKAEEQLKYYARKLEQSNEDLEQFAFIASHDLQAPLRKVRIFSEMLGPFVGEEGQETMRRIHTSVTKMQQLITDLLALSRINRKGKPFSAVHLNKVLDYVLDSLEPMIADAQGQVSVGDLDMVYGDSLQLEQLFQNMLSNGLKYHHPDRPPKVQVSGRRLGNGFYRLVIADNGIGFNEKYREKMFQPFERLHGESKYAGTGMGLAICKKILERHYGRISVSSQVGEGSMFTIDLPTGPSNLHSSMYVEQAEACIFPRVGDEEGIFCPLSLEPDNPIQNF